MDKNGTDRLVVSSLLKIPGIISVSRLLDEDRQHILDIEQDAEDRSLMGLGKVVNTGVRTVLKTDLVYVALSSMDFDWGCHSALILKKGQEVVGEEIRDKEAIARLSTQKNVWFMHKNFVVYRDRISFPSDIMKKICHFEIPPIFEKWGLEKGDLQNYSSVFSNPATPCDVYLKDKYFKGRDEKGLGTILMGLKPE